MGQLDDGDKIKYYHYHAYAMLGFNKLAGNARRFKMLMGMSLQEFDLLLVKVEKMYPEEERKRLSKRSRQREIGAGRRFALSLRDRVLLLLFYYRTYATQDVAAEIFGVGQATVSRSIDQMEPIVRQCVPIPAKLYAESKRVSTVEELEEFFPGLISLVDASEQPIQRPKRKDMEKSHYSGKAGRHTVKTQYTVNVHGLIIHNSRHSPGRVHDFKVYKMKHPTFPKNLPSQDGSARKGKRANLRSYGDRGYQGAQKVDPDVEVVLPIRRKPDKELSPEEREINRLQSKVRVYVENAIRRVKTHRIMGDRYRNPLKKYDRINDIVCGLVNHRVLWMAAQAT